MRRTEGRTGRRGLPMLACSTLAALLVGSGCFAPAAGAAGRLGVRSRTPERRVLITALWA